MSIFTERKTECDKYDQCLDWAAKKNLPLNCYKCDPPRVTFENPKKEVKEMAEKKICTKCLQEKSLEEFSKNRANKDGKEVWCKQCKKELQQKYRDKKLSEKRNIGRKARRKRIFHPSVAAMAKIEDAIFLPPESIKALRNAGIKEAIKILERALA